MVHGLRSAHGRNYSQVASEAGVWADTIRHYERVGLLPLPDRRANGYRTFREEDVVRSALAAAADDCPPWIWKRPAF